MKTIEINTTIKILEDSELSDLQQKLVEAARQATFCSYAPYSHFYVGAACLLDNGIIVSGCNQENAAYPSGLCAERVALFSAHAQYPKAKILKLCIVGRGSEGSFLDDICAPCGACRQVILEAEYRSQSPIEILLPTAKKGTYAFNGIGALLPFGFVPDNMV